MFLGCDGRIPSHLDRGGSGPVALVGGRAVGVRITSAGATDRAAFDFTQPAELLGWLRSRCQRRQPLTLICRRGGWDYTLAGVWDWLERRRWSWEPPGGLPRRRPGVQVTSDQRWPRCVVTDPPVILRCWMDHHRVQCLDIRNWIPALALPACRGQHDADWVCETLVPVLCRWQHLGLGAWRATIGATALAVYQTHYQPYPFYPARDPAVLAAESQAYFGGFTHAFYRCSISTDGVGPDALGEVLPGVVPGAIRGPVWEYDVRSLYPGVISGHRLPHAYYRSWGAVSVKRLADILKRFECVSQVSIRRGLSAYPCRTAAGVAYFRGTAVTHLCGTELRHALDAGEVDRVLSVHSYRRSHALRGFVSALYSRRTAAESHGDTAASLIFKLLLNSLYGKYAQRTPTWEDAPGVTAPQAYCTWSRVSADGARPAVYRSLAWHVQKKCESVPAKHSFVALAACITSAARDRMRGLRSICGVGGVLIQTVDSLWVTDSARLRLLAADRVGANLGSLRLVHGPCYDGVIWSAYDYRIGEKTVRVGVVRDSPEGLSGRFSATKRASLSRQLSAGGGSQVRTVTDAVSLDRHVTSRDGDTPESRPVPWLPADDPRDPDPWSDQDETVDLTGQSEDRSAPRCH